MDNNTNFCNLYAHLSNFPLTRDITCMDNTKPIYLAVQNNIVLGIFDSVEGAEERINAEIQKDRLNLLLKKGLLKKLLKTKGSKEFKFDDVYVIAEVKSYEIPQLF